MDNTLFQLVHGLMSLNEQVTAQQVRIEELEAELARAKTLAAPAVTEGQE